MLVNANVDDKFLDLSNLEVGSVYKKVAYVYNSKSGNSILNEGFFTFYLKDINANSIVARLFSVENFTKAGIIATKFKRKPVEVYFEVQEFRDEKSLIVTQIDLYTGSDFPYESFIGKVKDLDKIQNTVSSRLSSITGKDIELYNVYKTFSTSRIADGRCGAYLLALEMVVSKLVMCVRLPEVDLKELFNTFYIVQKQYYRYLNKLEDFDVETDLGKVRLLTDTVNSLSNSNEFNLNVIIDTLSAILGISRPEHLYAHLISSAFREAIESINLAYINSSMTMASKKNVGDGKYLIRY